MIVTESLPSRTAALAGRLGLIASGAGAARLRIFAGTMPVSPDAGVEGAPLVEITLADPPGAVADGTLTLVASGPAMVAVSGDATWARVLSRGGAPAFDLDAGPTGSGAACVLSTTALFAGGSVALVSARLE